MKIDILKANKPPLHVLPENDLKDHIEEGSSCPCNPRVEVSGESFIVIHNAYDGRD